MEIGGKKVVDATKPLHIEISADDAAKGKNKNPSNCAAAVAIIRGYKKDGAKQARVHLGRVYVEYPDKWIRYVTPDTLRAEIISFDRGASAQFMTGEYNLGAPSPADRLGKRTLRASSGKQSGNGLLTKSKRIKIAKVRHVIEGVRARGANR